MRVTDRDPFAGRPYDAREHFRLCFYGAVLLLRDRVLGTADLPDGHFLIGYLDQLQGTPLVGLDPADAWVEWDRRLTEWETAAPVRLPLVALREAAGLDRLGMNLLALTGLPEEDPRFGAVFEAIAGVPGRDRPTVGVLVGWWNDADERAAARRSLARLVTAGVVTESDPTAPPAERTVHPAAALWDALRGDSTAMTVPWADFEPPETLPAADELILADRTHDRVKAVPHLLDIGGARLLLIRGAEGSGRRTIARAVARDLGRGTLDVSALATPDDPRWPVAGALATVLHALPVVTVDPAPGERTRIPDLATYSGPVAVRLPPHGGVDSSYTAVTVLTEMPDPAARARHWAAALTDHQMADLPALAASRRVTGGTIRSLARLAVAEAAAAGRAIVTGADVAAASRSLHAELLDTLAARVPGGGGWADLVVSERVRDELLLLERRCRCRERLPDGLPAAFGAGFGPGVRALFTGPSGTGKSLAARLLATALGREIYRLDLSTVVNKYLGETEKNLDLVLSRAEALDVVLLVDEGDALLTQRTDVQTSNDRYANLETNFLLQRLESFAGILVVTTNAEDRIDDAFERRIDVAIDFATPGPAERWAIWRLHLPSGHLVAESFLREVAVRCALTGGQIRNAVLHAVLLAIDDEGAVTTGQLEAAVRREYRKSGGLCPLRTRAVADA